jgi:hypothetical protein
MKYHLRKTRFLTRPKFRRRTGHLRPAPPTPPDRSPLDPEPRPRSGAVPQNLPEDPNLLPRLDYPPPPLLEPYIYALTVASPQRLRTTTQTQKVENPHGGSTQPHLVKAHQRVERCTPARRRPTPWTSPSATHGQTGPSDTQQVTVESSPTMIKAPPRQLRTGSSCLGHRQVVIDAELTAFKAALQWHLRGVGPQPGTCPSQEPRR